MQQARTAGCSWAAIGGALGVTKQAAQQRYTGDGSLLGRLVGAVGTKLSSMFARFTTSARAVVVTAQVEARRLGHDQVGAEHVLVGVAEQRDSTGSKALMDCGVDAARLRAAVEEVHGRGTHRASGHIRFSPQAKKLLELSLRQAVRLKDNHIGTEHIVLGLLTDTKGPALGVLAQCGVDRDALREAVLDRLDPQAPG